MLQTTVLHAMYFWPEQHLTGDQHAIADIVEAGTPAPGFTHFVLSLPIL